MCQIGVKFNVHWHNVHFTLFEWKWCSARHFIESSLFNSNLQSHLSFTLTSLFGTISLLFLFILIEWMVFILFYFILFVHCHYMCTTKSGSCVQHEYHLYIICNYVTTDYLNYYRNLIKPKC